MGKLRLFAPAKINLFLHILGQKPNGYHQLQTIFQLLNWGDNLEFTLLPDKKLVLSAPTCPFPIESNLVYRAAKLLQQISNTGFGAHITLTKHLPWGAGLGGGSSNAGTTLRALNQLWQLGLSTAELIELAKQLGADVPIFVLGQNAWAEGIGEQLTPMTLPKQYYVIINPGCAVETKQIFQHADLPRHTPAITYQHYQYETTRNDCEDLVCSLYPDIAKARDWLNQFGMARLTGTGSSLFLPVADQITGENIQRQVPSHWHCVVCHSLDQQPASYFTIE